ncbi:MAG: cyclodeaminase/cyclohydrolase family protein [Phycisphaerae bacterium]|nr:cyclodeaminase/cyclohydrolase family protein [Phycisphaerae bacterium]
MDRLADLSLDELLAAVAARTPTPGGGAVAAAVGALASALGQMALAYSAGAKTPPDVRAALDDAMGRFARARTLLMELAAEDAHAFERLQESQRLPKDSPDRPERLAAAAELALGPPRATLAACSDLLRLMESIAPSCSRFLRSDLAIAAVLADAAARASRWNIRVNLPLLRDDHARETAGAGADAIVDACDARRRRVEETCLG